MRKIAILTLTAVFLLTMSLFLSGCNFDELFPDVTSGSSPEEKAEVTPSPTPEPLPEPKPEPTPEPKPEPKPEKTPTPEPVIAGYKFPFSFSIEGLYGETVTEEDLGEKELFMVYLWAVW